MYAREGMPIGLRILIHMGSGTIVFLATAFLAGWVSAGEPGGSLRYILLGLGIAALIWGLFMLYFRLEARRINRKLRERA
ncbi:MAG: DUF3021 domain-containing protein [Clostridia bacterium]|nr:DUF3021 domain-containing protein [Clostridia bacterium]